VIVYEPAASAAARIGETVVAGRRLAGRLLPYGLDPIGPSFRFDPVERCFKNGRPDTIVLAGPADPEAWREALARIPEGPVLIGPCAPAEEVRGAFRAAAEAAIASGRAVYLLDPEPAGLPVAAGGAAVVLCSWRPGRAAAAFPGLAEAHAAGLRAAALVPLLPGWTAEPEELGALIAAARAGGAASLSAIVPASDGPGRRAIVAAREAASGGAADRFFDLIHHGDWPSQMSRRVSAFQSACTAAGLSLLPPRAIGRGTPPGNVRAAARLEELAETSDRGDHHAALLHAAVRWIDEAPRDLAAVAREGNFRKVFPFPEDIRDEAEAALAAAP
jgi:hypothetical protein